MKVDTKTIRERAEKATPGPYELDAYGLMINAPSKKGGVWRIADIRGWGYLTGKGSGALGLDAVTAEGIQRATGEFLTAARTDVPALCDALDESRAEVERLRKALEGLTRVGNRIVLTVPKRDNPHHDELTRAVGLGIANLAEPGAKEGG